LLAVAVLASGWTIAPLTPTDAAADDRRVEAWLLVRSTPPSLIEDRKSAATEFEFGLFKRTQAELIRTPMVLMTAVRSAEIAELPLLAKQKHPIRWLQKEIQVDFPGDSEVMRVSMPGGSEEVAKIVNAVVNAYFAEIVDREKLQRSSNYDVLMQTSDGLRQQIQREHENYKRLSETLGTTSQDVIKAEQKLAHEQLSSASQLMSQLRTKQMEIASQLEVLSQQPDEASKTPEHLVQQELGKDPEMALRLPRLIDLETELAEARFAAAQIDEGAESPQIVRLTRRVEVEKVAISRRTELLRPSIETDLEARAPKGDPLRQRQLETELAYVEQRLAEENGQLDELQARLKKLASTSPDLLALERKIEQLEHSYRRVSTELRAIEVELKAPSRVVLIQQAVATE
jgi:polysaccharide biosynthesis transport protein